MCTLCQFFQGELLHATVSFAIVEIREVKYGDRTGIYWLGSYPFPLAKRDVSLITIGQ